MHRSLAVPFLAATVVLAGNQFVVCYRVRVGGAVVEVVRVVDGRRDDVLRAVFSADGAATSEDLPRAF
jgi:hypothetical protein